MWLRSILTLFCLLPLALGPAHADEPGRLVVTTKGEDGKPLGRVQVVAWNEDSALRGETGADGQWATDAPAGTYSIGVRAHARVGTERYEVEVKAGETTPVSMEMGVGVQFLGRVVDAANKPVVGASILVEVGGSFEGYMERTFNIPPWARDRTNAEGHFYVGGIPDGKVATIVATAEGMQTTRMSVRALDGRIRPDPVVVRMGEGASVSGRVTHSDGKPAGGVSVYVIPTAWPKLLASPTLWISSSDGGEIRALQGTTDDDGRYRVEGAEVDREYLVKAAAEGFSLSAAAQPVTPTKDDPAVRSDVVLRRGGGLRVRLVAPDGSAVRTAKVRVGTTMDAPELEGANEGDHYVFAGLTLGMTAVEVEAPGFLGHIGAVELKSGTTEEVEIALDPGLRITGVLRSVGGAPIAGVRVAAPFEVENPVTGWTSLEDVEATTDANGHFDLGPLRPGSYKLKMYSSAWELTEATEASAPAEGAVLTARPLGTAVARLLLPDGTPYAGSLFLWQDTPGVSGTRSGESRHVDEGRVTLTGFGPTPLRVSFLIDGFATVHRMISSPDGSKQDLGDIRLDPGVTLRGRALLPSGAPAVEARVLLGEESVDSDAEGRFSFEHVPVGPCVVSVKVDDLPKAFHPLEAGADEREHVLQLVEGVVVRVSILDAAGKPSPRGWVLVDQKIGERWHPWGSGRAEESGRFEGRLPPGLVRFRSPQRKDGPPPKTLLEVELVAGTPQDLTLRLPPAPR